MPEEHDPRPVPPKQPDSDECCGQGCALCVWDKYDMQMERYKDELDAWVKRHPDTEATDDCPKRTA